MRALIIEDEPRAASRLQKLIAQVDSSIIIVDILESVEEANCFFSRQKVDVVFSDIQLADGLSFEIYTGLNHIPPIIFTTAYDQYAIKAFKNNGVDYLLKPVQINELQTAIEKVKNITKPHINNELLAVLAQQIQPQNNVYKERFMVKTGQHIKSISINDIAAFYSLDKGTYILTHSGKNYLLDFTLDHTESLLNPDVFFRINRKFILHIAADFEITAWTNSRLKIDIKGYTHDMLIVARNRTKDFKRWLGDTAM